MSTWIYMWWQRQRHSILSWCTGTTVQQDFVNKMSNIYHTSYKKYLCVPWVLQHLDFNANFALCGDMYKSNMSQESGYSCTACLNMLQRQCDWSIVSEHILETIIKLWPYVALKYEFSSLFVYIYMLLIVEYRSANYWKKYIYNSLFHNPCFICWSKKNSAGEEKTALVVLY